MIQKLLIANRGEIACRIIRTAHDMGIATVAVYSDADAKALHVRQADEAVHIGPSPAAESYLVGEKIIAAAKDTGADAIHPGYGFLSENAGFAQAVIDAGLIWVGPKPSSIDAMGLKDAAKKLMREAGWQIDPKTKKLTYVATGEVMTFEFLLVSPLFERIALPYTRNLKRLGIDARVRTVDSSQYKERVDKYDFDIVVSGWGQSLSPGNEQRSFWGSTGADVEGGRNFVGIKDKVIDELIEKVIAAPDRKALVASVKALDRVLQWGHWVIPHWHAKYDRVAYWDKFGRPRITPIQGNQFLAWWVDPKKEEALKSNIASAIQ